MKAIRKSAILLWLFLFFFGLLSAENSNYLSVKPKDGDGILNILKRYMLPADGEIIDKFKELNRDSFDKNGGLKMGTEYKLPIAVFRYDGKSIRSTVGNNDMAAAKKIQDYNIKLYKSGIKDSDYRKSGILWVPLFGLPPTAAEKTSEENAPKNNYYEILGRKYAKVKIIDSKLKGQVFYLVGGHGGPDPGAVGYSGSNELCEDEYAYDVILRLGRNLLQHGAAVYFIVRDSTDGIRDEKYLKCDNDEFNFDGTAIPLNQIDRLNKRTDIVNSLYNKNKKKYSKQYQVEIHVDSRETKELIDIFFYYAPGNQKGKKYANGLYETIRKKYDAHQPGRGYKGFVEERNLHTLRKSQPTTVYIELGNIQSPQNQTRLLESGNRQTIADWLCDGILMQR